MELRSCICTIVDALKPEITTVSRFVGLVNVNRAYRVDIFLIEGLLLGVTT